MDVLVTAMRRFQHGGRRERGDSFRCSMGVAEQLMDRGLVYLPEFQPPLENPTEAAGTPSSASPADQVSPPQTSSSSEPGEIAKPKRRARKAEA